LGKQSKVAVNIDSVKAGLGWVGLGHNCKESNAYLIRVINEPQCV